MALARAEVGKGTGSAGGGVMSTKTGGKPSALRNDCTLAKTDGTGGSTASTAWRMSDCSTWLLRHVKRLLETTVASNHAEIRTATTATTTPNAESMKPSRRRRIAA